jgi:hypothetical protein
VRVGRQKGELKMKRFLHVIVTTVVIATLSVLLVEGYSGTLTWELYDDFESGVIDLDRWDIDIDDSSATITIESGRAKFVHNPGFAESYSWLKFKKGVKKIRGIRATVEVESCTGDVRGRIAGWIGMVGDDYVWNQLALQGGLDRIFGRLSVKDRATEPPTTLYHLFTGRFTEPKDLIRNTFTIAMVFSQKKLVYKASGLGKIIVKLPEALLPTDFRSKGIGTKSTNGDGPCVVYFDDVYVLIK